MYVALISVGTQDLKGTLFRLWTLTVTRILATGTFYATLLADGLAEYFKTFFSMALGYTCSTAIKFVYYSKIFCPGCSFPNYCAVGSTIIFHNATQADFGRTQYTS